MRHLHEHIYIDKEDEWYYTNWEGMDGFNFAKRLDKRPGSSAKGPMQFWIGAMIESPATPEIPPGEHYGHWATFKFHERHLFDFMRALMDGYNHMVRNMREKQRKEAYAEQWKEWRKVDNIRLYVPKNMPEPTWKNIKENMPVKVGNYVYKLELQAVED